MKFHVILLGFALVCMIQSSYAFKKKEKLALAFLAGMVVGQQGRHGGNYPVPVPWPVQGGSQVMPLPLPIPIGGGGGGGHGQDKKVVHNILKHHHHFKGGHQQHLEDDWQSEWPSQFGGHSRVVDEDADLSGFGGKFGGNFLGQGFDSHSSFGSSFGGETDFGGLTKKYFSKPWDHRVTGPSSYRRRYNFMNDDFGEDFGSNYRTYGALSKYMNRLPLFESKPDYRMHSFFDDSISPKGESSYSSKSQISSSVSHPPIYKTLVSVSEKPPAVRPTS